MAHIAETHTTGNVSGGGNVPVGVSQIAEREKLGDSVQSEGSRIFLNGDKIAADRWVGLVYELHEAAEKPNLIVVFSDHTEWAQMNALRHSIVKNGGILQRTETGDFRSSVKRWLDRLNQVPDPVTTAPPPVAPGSWDRYQGSFARDDEFDALVSELNNESQSGKSSIS